MSTINNPGQFDCLSKLQRHADEPFFVLRGQDRFAPALVRAWADEAEKQGCPVEKLQEARDCADQMEAYGDRKFPD